ncbi:MAG: hypothetical protein ACI4VQ_04470 [Clostridia bacterium]
MEDIIKLVLVDKVEEIENEYFVKVDETTDEKTNKLMELLKTYESYQEIEDFIDENFEVIKIDEIYLEY